MKKYQIIIWLAALVVGVGVGLLRIDAVDAVMSVIATIYTDCSVFWLCPQSCWP